MTLIAHRGTKFVAESQVMEVLPPLRTKSWNPVSHKEILVPLFAELKRKKIEVVSKKYSMSKDGDKMFAVIETGYETGKKDNKMGLTIGVRNSLDKSMAVGICAGSRVFVCDNMAFSGEMIKFNKHTNGLDADRINELVESAVALAEEKIVDFAN
jgi:hypothetical protein